MRLQLSDKGAKNATFRQLPAEFTPVLRSSDNEKTELLPTLAGLPWQEPFSLGVGVDAVTGATAGRAVKSFDPELETIMTSSERINFVQSESDLTREIELMAKGEYNVSNIKISASMEYMSKVSYSDLAVTIIAKYEAFYDGYDEAENYELTEEARELLENDPQAFRRAYGDYFVAGVKRGSRFIAIYECRSSSFSKMEEFKATISVDLPDIFSAEGSVRFKETASETNTRYNVSLFMEGYDHNAPGKPDGPWTPEKILEALSWFKANEVGLRVQAKLQHYSTIVPTYPRTVDIGPPAFVEMQRLYSTLWVLRARYGTCPAYYQQLLAREFGDLDREITANQGRLPDDHDLRYELQLRTDAFAERLNAVFSRWDFYSRVVSEKETEPEKEVPIRSDGRREWLYGFGSYGRSEEVVLQQMEFSEHKLWELARHQQHTFDWSPPNGIIVGWKVTAVWNEPTNGVWEKLSDEILLSSQALVRVTSDYLRGYYWSLTIYWVLDADYQFDKG